MKIINKTRWDTRDLRRIICRVLRTMRRGGHWDDAAHQRIEFRITSARQHRATTGNAYVRGRRANLFVPACEDYWTTETLVDFAAVVAHEAAHVFGRTGERHMRSSLWWGRPKRNGYRDRAADHPIWGWAATETIRARRIQRVVETPVEAHARRQQRRAALVASRGERAARQLAKWERRLASAKRQVTKARRRFKYYQRRLAAQNGAAP